MSKESMQYDVVIVGAGPAGLSCAYQLKKINPNLSVCVLEKGATAGAQIVSGAVLEPRALNELIPDWAERGAPVTIAVKKDSFALLSKHHKLPLPVPPQMKNEGNFIIRPGQFVQWLAKEAEQVGVDIFPGFSATQCLFDDAGRVIGVVTGDKGLNKEGNPGPHYQAGYELYSKQLVLAEGCRGSLSKFILSHFNLHSRYSPQTYALGIKEVWEVNSAEYEEGKVMHTIGWPLDHSSYGGSFVYHLDQNQVALGFVVGLDYRNTYLSPFEEMQRFKTHPSIKKLLLGGKRLSYSARALSEGGYQSLPGLVFEGGVIVGDAAGFLNVLKIKGNHTAMKSGMLAAEAIAHAIETNSPQASLYPEKIKASWLEKELYSVRNIRPGFKHGLIPGLLYAALDTYLLKGSAPWTFKNHADHLCLLPYRKCKKISYPKPDQVLTFDRLSSVFLSNTRYEEDQPCHLQLLNPEKAMTVNYEIYASPETRYCPAAVYELVREGNKKRLQINFANCIQCKSCDIKDPTQNINWLPPEGGDGPNYQD